MPRTFTEKVYEVVAHIPKGKVLTYKEVAQLAGSPQASRAAGMAMKCNPDTTKVPCHRVVASDGSMHGYSMGGVSVKIQKLKDEGVIFVKKRVDLQKSRWLHTS
jgi:O-6-methylguanine DNA methyltransferase